MTPSEETALLRNNNWDSKYENKKTANGSVRSFEFRRSSSWQLEMAFERKQKVTPSQSITESPSFLSPSSYSSVACHGGVLSLFDSQ
jgi:hypothetical protein